MAAICAFGVDHCPTGDPPMHADWPWLSRLSPLTRQRPSGHQPVLWASTDLDLWSGPLGADKSQAADLTIGRGLRSSNCCGLR